MDNISIILRCKNEERSLKQTLEKVLCQKTDTPVEIIAVDSGSTDNTLEILRKHKISVLQISPEKFSYGRSLNLGISLAQGSVICNLSAHCPPADAWWLQRLTHPILSGETHAAFGRQIPVPGINPLEEAVLEKLFPAGTLIEPPFPFSNANCSFLKKMWQELKFDEDLPRLEDLLWYTLLKEHYRFRYCPEAVVYHSHFPDLRKIQEISFNDGLAKKMILKKYGRDLLNEAYPTCFAKMKHVFADIGSVLRYSHSRKKSFAETTRILLLKLRGCISFRKGYCSLE